MTRFPRRLVGIPAALFLAALAISGCTGQSGPARDDGSAATDDATPESASDGATARPASDAGPEAAPASDRDATPSVETDATPTDGVDASEPDARTPTNTADSAPSLPEPRPETTPEPRPETTPEPRPETTPEAADGGATSPSGDAGPASKLSAEVRELTELVQKAYGKARGFEADFEQTYRNRLLDRQQESRGHVWLKPPTRMRWEYAAPTKNQIIADGRTLFVHEPEPNQVIRMPVGDSELPAVMAFLTGGRDLNEDYHVHLVEPNVSKSLAARGQAGLDLRPRRPSSVVERVVLVLGRDTGRVQKTVLVEPEGNTNTFIWSKVRTDVDIPDSRFTFTPPPGANVMDRGQ